MTKLTFIRAIKRETLDKDRQRPITITLMPFYCIISVKGGRESHNISYGQILDCARKLDFMAAERKRLQA